jgi:WD40 repeat protein
VKRLPLLLLPLILIAAVLHAQATEPFLVEQPDLQIPVEPVNAVAYSPDGRWIAAGGRDNTVHIYDAASGALVRILAGHTGWVTRVAWNPGGTRLASGGNDNTVRLWNAATGEQLQVFRHHSRAVTGLAFSRDGKLLASGSTDGTLWIGEAETGVTLATLINYSGPVWNMAFSPDGGSLVSGSEDGTIWWWGLYDSSVTRLDGHTAAVTALTFSPDRRLLATSSWDRTVRLWDTTSGETIRTLIGHQGPVTGVRFNGDGTQLVSSGLDGTLRLWDTATGEGRAVLKGHSPISGLSFNITSGRVVAGAIDGMLEIWDVNGRVETLLRSRPTLPPPVVIVPSATLAPPTSPPVVIVQPTAIPSVQPAPPTPVPPPAVAAGTPSLSIPTVNIFSSITTFPLDGVSWAIDPWEHNVGHFQGTAWINTSGNIALGAHSEYPDGSRGLFNGLYAVNVGDPLFLTDENGHEVRYVIQNKFTVHYTDLSVVYPSDSPRVTLITCDIPTWNPAINNYDQRLVVVAVPG